MAGAVLVEGRPAAKAGALVSTTRPLEVVAGDQYASRGGEKLAGALAAFNLDVDGLVAIDVGASTGGFTDCLLQNGAARVYAIDVGYGLLDYRLRQDPRVTVLERVNIRYLESLPEKGDIATIDVSFISLEKVIPAVMKLSAARRAHRRPRQAAVPGEAKRGRQERRRSRPAGPRRRSGTPRRLGRRRRGCDCWG